MERIDTSHSIWLFDSERMRFRRLPRGADPAAPSLEVNAEDVVSSRKHSQFGDKESKAFLCDTPEALVADAWLTERAVGGAKCAVAE